MKTMKQLGLWSSLGIHDSVVVIWWFCISSSGENQKIWLFKSNLTLKVKVIATQNNRDLNQAIFHLWSKFGNPSLNR